MNTISFMTANYVARQIDYHMTKGWMDGDDATNAYFAPIATYDYASAPLWTKFGGWALR